jgi:hypothetical protein
MQQCSDCIFSEDIITNLRLHKGEFFRDCFLDEIRLIINRKISEINLLDFFDILVDNV